MVRLRAAGQEGHLKVHTLDQGSGPILLSVETLRSLGAIIDFEQDLLVLKHLDPRRAIPLERSSTGHQLLPLSEDLYGQAISLSAPVSSLRDLVR